MTKKLRENAAADMLTKNSMQLYIVVISQRKPPSFIQNWLKYTNNSNLDGFKTFDCYLKEAVYSFVALFAHWPRSISWT
jgi:hypothetical protein